MVGWEGPSSALEGTGGGGGGSSCRGGEGATSTSETGCLVGQDESPGTSPESRPGVCDAAVIFISHTFRETSLFRFRLSFVPSPPAISTQKNSIDPYIASLQRNNIRDLLSQFDSLDFAQVSRLRVTCSYISNPSLQRQKNPQSVPAANGTTAPDALPRSLSPPPSTGLSLGSRPPPPPILGSLPFPQPPMTNGPRPMPLGGTPPAPPPPPGGSGTMANFTHSAQEGKPPTPPPSFSSQQM
ncbi:uncharacterized protein LOC110666294 [Hevea brasiliensis]|uniref:uncharacterized protein LOC110666294 n=1 Tax=Hevea brasiliensis TaxID=3981 RepID=UPI0025E1E32A|nr:uncharacterized protein LOC110666294 [Hevea brasiliensis]